MLREKMSYSEFLNSEERIATNILVSRLTILEEEKILVKAVSPENKSKYIYSLTQKGADLLPIIIELMDWGAKYNKNCPRKELGQRIKKNKTAVVLELGEVLKQKITASNLAGGGKSTKHQRTY
jgi:DNA-binding HxlR family transcriptional regulator